MIRLNNEFDIISNDSSTMSTSLPLQLHVVFLDSTCKLKELNVLDLVFNPQSNLVILSRRDLRFYFELPVLPIT